MPSIKSEKKRSASASVSESARIHVYAQLAAERNKSAATFSSRSDRNSLSSLPLAKERADSLLVAPAFRDDLLEAAAFQISPFLHEHGGDLELFLHHAEMAAQGQADLLGRRERFRNLVERGVERVGALAHRLVEKVLLPGDVGVERALLDAHGGGEVADRRPVVALLGE